jgi:hypothetical protein
VRARVCVRARANEKPPASNTNELISSECSTAKFLFGSAHGGFVKHNDNNENTAAHFAISRCASFWASATTPTGNARNAQMITLTPVNSAPVTLHMSPTAPSKKSQGFRSDGWLGPALKLSLSNFYRWAPEGYSREK